MKDCVESDAVAGSRSFGRLLDQARGGSHEALGGLLELFRDYLSLTAEANLDSEVRPKLGVSDLVQESMLEAHRDFTRFRGRSEMEFRAWLKQILLNNLLNQYRAWRATQKRQLGREIAWAQTGLRESGLAGFDDPTPSEIVSVGEQHDRLEQALQRLPPHYRQAILLRHRDGCGFAEIGRRLGRSPDAARMLWYRAFEQLSVELEALCREPAPVRAPATH